MHYQTTLKEKISFAGIGLHLGKKVNITINPAPVNSGIIFIRTETIPKVEIKAELSNVVDTTLDNSAFISTLGMVSVRINMIPLFTGAGFMVIFTFLPR